MRHSQKLYLATFLLLVPLLLGIDCGGGDDPGGSDGPPPSDGGPPDKGKPDGGKPCKKASDVSGVQFNAMYMGPSGKAVARGLAWGSTQPLTKDHVDFNKLQAFTAEALKAMPQGVVDSVARIVLVDQRTTLLNIDPGEKSVLKDLQPIEGYSRPDKSQVYAKGYTYYGGLMVVDVSHFYKDDGSGKMTLDAAAFKQTVIHEAGHHYDGTLRGYKKQGATKVDKASEQDKSKAKDIEQDWKDLLAQECHKDPSAYYVGGPDVNKWGFKGISDEVAQLKGAVRAYSLVGIKDDLATTHEDVLGKQCQGVKAILGGGNDQAKRTIIRKLQYMAKQGFFCPDDVKDNCGKSLDELAKLLAATPSPAGCKPKLDCAGLVGTLTKKAQKGASSAEIQTMDKAKAAAAKKLMSDLKSGAVTAKDLAQCAIKSAGDMMVSTMGGPKSCCWSGWWQTHPTYCANKKQLPPGYPSCAYCRFYTTDPNNCGSNRDVP